MYHSTHKYISHHINICHITYTHHAISHTHIQTFMFIYTHHRPHRHIRIPQIHTHMHTAWHTIAHQILNSTGMYTEAYHNTLCNHTISHMPRTHIDANAPIHTPLHTCITCTTCTHTSQYIAHHTHTIHAHSWPCTCIPTQVEDTSRTFYVTLHWEHLLDRATLCGSHVALHMATWLGFPASTP